MLASFKLLRNLGQFDSVSAGAGLPLARLSLMYAENGRGKTTLAAVLRSFATGNALPIVERHRLSSTHEPHVVLGLSDGSEAVFQNGAWSQSLDDVAIYDDVFVDENVYSGLVVAPGHRQRLHELILGAEGITITRELEQLARAIEQHSSNLRTLSAAIPADVRGPFNVDDFCALTQPADLDRAIQDTTRALAAGQAQQRVQAAELFDVITLPAFDLTTAEQIVPRDIPALGQEAMDVLQRHLATVGPGGEAWVAEGVRRLGAANGHDAATCPFCAQSLLHSPVIESYQAYFSTTYTEHLASIDEAIKTTQQSHGGDVLAAFERRVRVAVERRQLWAEYADVPDLAIDTAEVARARIAARNLVVNLLEAKKRSPLEQMSVSEEIREAVSAYDAARQTVRDASDAMQAANRNLEVVKERAGTANVDALRTDLARLTAMQARFRQDVADRCTEKRPEGVNRVGAGTKTERS